MVRNSRRQHNMQRQPEYTKNKEDYPEPRNAQVASASETINLLIKDVKKKNSRQQTEKVDQFNQKQLIHQQKSYNKQFIPLSVTYS